MEVSAVVQELRDLNGRPPVFNPARDKEQQITDWIAWSAGETLARKFDEQCSKRTAGAQEEAKAARSTSTGGIRAKDYLARS